MKKRKQRLAPLFLAGVLAVGSLLIGGSLEAKAAGADHLVSTADEGQYLAVSGGRYRAYNMDRTGREPEMEFSGDVGRKRGILSRERQ